MPDAREAWQALANMAALNDERLHLFHSRYALQDRLRIENEMLSYFGRDSNAAQRYGRVLVSTQVVEQSLDLDFDVMVSDLAPMDLLIQRAGRLQRHTRDAAGNRCGGADQRGTPTLSVFSPLLSDEPTRDWYKQVFPKANAVYPHTLLLWRTAQWLADHGGWDMPDDARAMLEFVYDESATDIPAALMQTTQQALGESTAQRDMGNFSSLDLTSGYSKSAQWDEEARIATRLGEESQTVYLACWQAGELVPWATEAERFAWDLSSLNISHRQLTKLAPLTDKALRNALLRLREEEMLFNEYSVILPLVLSEQGAWACVGVNGKDEWVDVSYDALGGLVIETQ